MTSQQFDLGFGSFPPPLAPTAPRAPPIRRGPFVPNPLAAGPGVYQDAADRPELIGAACLTFLDVIGYLVLNEHGCRRCAQDLSRLGRRKTVRGARRAAWFATTKALVSPPRSVIFDAGLCEPAGRQPGSFTLASHSKLNDLLPDQLCHAISQTVGELKFGAHGFKRLVHDADLLGLESDSLGRVFASWSRLMVRRPRPSERLPGQRAQMCDGHEELKACGHTTEGNRSADRRR
jgi:hypothetical protein